MQVTLETRGALGLIVIDSPPVNALSHALRALIGARLVEVRARAELRGLVIACAGPSFIAGSEIRELGQASPPTLPEVIAAIEDLGIPTLAAMHGTALGGGFELALACRMRTALAGTRIGLPEVTLGLLPGAGGTVRTTRLAGALTTLELAGTGTPMPVAEALRRGLVDAVFEADLVERSLAILSERIAADTIPAAARDRAPEPEATGDAAFEAAAQALSRATRHSAHELVVASVRNARRLPFEEALARERQLFLDAARSPRSVALRHLFFAEREAAKPAGAVAEAEPRPVARVGVIGAGTMGSGIAIAFANAGYDVLVRETDKEALERGLARIGDTYAGSVTRGSLAADEAAARRARVSGVVEMARLGACELIVEAAFEELEIKRAIFAELDAIAKPGAILATNTSYLDVDAIAASTGRAGDVLGLHFFSPANVMRLVEIVRGAATGADVLATGLQVARRLGKQPVVVGVCRGFVGNRMLMARNAPVAGLLLEGAAPAEIDAAFRDFGWPMGPCEMQDLAGLDISWRNRRSLGIADPLPDRLCELGRLGRKAGRGWYRYEAGDRTPQPDPEVAGIIRETATSLGIAWRKIDAAEIIRLTHAPLVAEGTRILDEGIAARASDIDVIWVHGYGFPRDLGGPMHWARHHPDGAAVRSG